MFSNRKSIETELNLRELCEETRETANKIKQLAARMRADRIDRQMRSEDTLQTVLRERDEARQRVIELEAELAATHAELDAARMDPSAKIPF